MRTTVNTLSGEIQKAQTYMERARTAEVGQAQAAALTGSSELTLPGGDPPS
jgi:hypothetical protein